MNDIYIQFDDENYPHLLATEVKDEELNAAIIKLVKNLDKFIPGYKNSITVFNIEGGFAYTTDPDIYRG